MFPDKIAMIVQVYIGQFCSQLTVFLIPTSNDNIYSPIKHQRGRSKHSFSNS